MKPLLSLLTVLAITPLVAEVFDWKDHYAIEDIPNPPGKDPQIGGMDITKDGKLIVALHRGEIMIYDEPGKSWSLFATGLHEPLGLMVEEEGTVLIVQRPEVTRIHDTDQDGTADFYETVSSDWGMTGNYHEFAFGIVKDSKKNIYVALGAASNGSGVREEIRGEWNDTGGMTHERFLYGGDRPEWSQRKKGTPRMYAKVPSRGCVVKIPHNSSNAEVFATGFRTPNGLLMDDHDQLWLCDNQGDWLGASKLFRVEKDRFHGHVASLLWGKNPPTEEPSTMDPAPFDKIRVRAAALLPQGDCGNSVTQILPVPANKTFAPLTNTDSLLLGEMNHARLVRYLPDEVNGSHQGSATHFLNDNLLVRGNNRMVYSPDKKTMFLGKTHLSWAGYEGLKKVTYKGTPYFSAESLKLTPTGFTFTFNDDISPPSEKAHLNISSYKLAYHAAYGSPKIDEKQQPVRNVTVKGNTLIIDLKNKPLADHVYDIQFSNASGKNLGPLSHPRFWYTAHKVYE